MKSVFNCLNCKKIFGTEHGKMI